MSQIDQIAAQVAHSIDLQRLANGIASGQSKALEELAKVIRDILIENDTIPTKKLYNEIIKRVTAEVTDTTGAIVLSINDSLTQIQAQEINFQWATVNALINVVPAKPKVANVVNAIENTNLILNDKVLSWNERIGAYEENTLKQVTDRIKLGWASGETTADISKDIIKKLDKTKAATNALVKDLISHTSSITKQQVAKENDDIIIGERTIVTLDSRTSPICQGYGSQDGWGKLWIYAEVGRKFKRPPFHFRCRSTNIFVINPEYAINADYGTRPAVVNGQAIQVPHDTGWLDLAKKYPSIADQALGKTRAKLIDEMSADEFYKIAYDSLGNEITIDEMIANSKRVASLLR